MATRPHDVLKSAEATRPAAARAQDPADSIASEAPTIASLGRDFLVHPPDRPPISYVAAASPTPPDHEGEAAATASASSLHASSSSSNAAPSPSSTQHLDQVAALSHDIMQRYPPEQYHYLGLGRSPTPVIAYMQAMHPRHGVIASNMPLSKFSARHSTATEHERHLTTTELTTPQQTRLDEHFQNFVPSNAALAGRRILMMDYVQSGQSLFAAHRHLHEHLQKRRSWLTGEQAPDLVSLPLTAPHLHEKVGATVAKVGLTEPPIAIPGSLDDPASLATKMGAKAFEHQAEYPSFKVNQDDPPTHQHLVAKRNDDFDRLREVFAQRRGEASGYDADNESE